MMSFQSETSAIVRINLQFLFAFGCGGTAWAIWPQTAEWWGFGFMSIILGLAAVGGVIKALRMMVTLLVRRRALAEFRAQGGQARADRMAHERDLKDRGMIR